MSRGATYNGPRGRRLTVFTVLVGEAHVELRELAQTLRVKRGQTLVLNTERPYVYVAAGTTSHVVNWCESNIADDAFISNLQIVTTTQRMEWLHELGATCAARSSERQEAMRRHLGHALLLDTAEAVYRESRRIAHLDTTGQLRELFSAHPDRAWTLSTISRALGMSSRTMSRRLRMEGASTATKILWSERLRRAVTLLGQTALTSGETANACGFRSVYHFSRRIKESTGMRPTALKQWLRDCSLAERQRLLLSM